MHRFKLFVMQVLTKYNACLVHGTWNIVSLKYDIIYYIDFKIVNTILEVILIWVGHEIFTINLSF